MRKKILIGLVVAAVLIVGYVFWPSTATNTYTNTNVVANANTNISTCTTTSLAGAAVSYTGKAGVTAAALLTQNSHTMGKDASGLINAIDSVKPGDRQYWAFYVNCQLAQVGAEQYTTKDGDIIHWKLDSF